MVNTNYNLMYTRILKSFLDFTFSLIGLLILSPIFILLIFILSIQNKGSAFFLQPRPGKNEKIFNVIKFKTMNDHRDASGNLLPDSQRLTLIGNFIRKTSLDEIPQLINVLKGDMSLIGPRPLRTYYLPLYNSEQKRRHMVRPGITGWAQVNGRNNISWRKKFELDVWYVENLKFSLDVKILFLTLIKILKRDNIYDSDGVVKPFNGNN